MNCKSVVKHGEPLLGPSSATEEMILRRVLFADYLKLLVPGGSAVVSFLLEPSDHIFLMIHVNGHMVSLPQRTKSEDVSPGGIHLEVSFGAQGFCGHLRGSDPIWSGRGCR